jgi:hypothetical protein
MQTAPVMPPPRPPRGGNLAMASDDWHENPNAGRRAKWFRYGRMLAKFVVLLLFAIAVGQLGLVLFQIVRLGLFS